MECFKETLSRKTMSVKPKKAMYKGVVTGNNAWIRKSKSAWNECLQFFITSSFGIRWEMLKWGDGKGITNRANQSILKLFGHAESE